MLDEAKLDRILGGHPCFLVHDAEDLSRRPTSGLGTGPAGQTLGHRVHVVDAALRVRRDHCVTDRIQGHLHPLLGFEEPPFGTLAISHVDTDADNLVDRTAGVLQRHLDGMEPAFLATAADETDFPLDTLLPASGNGFIIAAQSLQQLRIADEIRLRTSDHLLGRLPEALRQALVGEANPALAVDDEDEVRTGVDDGSEKGALRLDLLLRPQQPFDQLDVAEAGGNVGDEDVEQCTVDRLQNLPALEEDGRFLTRRRLQVKDGIISAEQVLATRHTAHDRGDDSLVG